MILSVVIQQFCEDNLEDVEVKNEKLYAKCPNPTCENPYNHFNISLVTGLFHCYRCGFSGNFYYLGRYLKGNKFNLKNTLKEYESNITFEMLESIYSKETQPLEIPDWTVDTKELKGNSLLVRRALEYLKSRGIDRETATHYQMRLGLSDKYKNHVIMPVVEEGVVKNFVARRFKGKGKRYTGPLSSEGYVKKSQLFWGLDNVGKERYRIIVVEGIFDAIALLQKGYPTIALLGKDISIVQVKKIVELTKRNVETVTILMDEGFLKEAIKIGHYLEGFVETILIAQMLGEGDPSSDVRGAIKAIENAKGIDCY